MANGFSTRLLSKARQTYHGRVHSEENLGCSARLLGQRTLYTSALIAAAGRRRRQSSLTSSSRFPTTTRRNEHKGPQGIYARPAAAELFTLSGTSAQQRHAEPKRHNMHWRKYER